MARGFAFLLLVLAFLSLSLPGLAQQDEKALADIQQQIKDRQQALRDDLAGAKALEQQLKQQELEIAKLATELNKLAQQLRENRDQTQQLSQQRDTLQTQKIQQQTVLAKQIRSAYMAGDHDYAKMLFNLNQASNLERMLTYYRYLNQARQQQIAQFVQLSQQLAGVIDQLNDKAAQLTRLQASQRQQQQLLTRQQQNRKKTLASLNQHIADQAAQVEQLQINEQALIQAIEQASARARDAGPLSLDGLTKFKGKLTLPVKGQLQSRFGKRRQGQIRWKGIMVYADTGTEVNAVADAQVIYADWLKGFGLVIALDHGDGFMSLYGHNQALLHNAGDNVRAGQAIALVGQSGGQTTSGLYFELRHKGEALNPANWLQRR